jgi:hypothetical protein
LPAFGPGYFEARLACCTAETVTIRGRDFGARGGVDLFDDDREVGARPARFVVEKGPIHFAQDGVRGEKYAGFERFEEELAVVRGSARRVGRRAARPRVARKCRFTFLQPAQRSPPCCLDH